MTELIIDRLAQALEEANPRLRIERLSELHGGFSADRKFLVETAAEEHLLLRAGTLDQSDSKQREFDMLGRVATLDVLSPRPVKFGLLPKLDCWYMLLTYVEGEDATQALPELSLRQQYEVGWQAGRELARMHHLPAPASTIPWPERMTAKYRRYYAGYLECGVPLEGAEPVVAYVEERMQLMEGRPNRFQHGDFHVGNIVVKDGQYAGAIDFNRWDWGDPWEEFYKLGMFSREVSVPFSVGQIHGYFDGEPPALFWKLYGLYTAMYIYPSITWTLRVAPDTLEEMMQRLKRVIRDHRGFETDIPTWYQDWNQARLV